MDNSEPRSDGIVIEHGHEQGQIEELMIGSKLRLRVFPVDHKPDMLEMFKRQMATEIAKPDVKSVVVEYFPPEIKRLQNNEAAKSATNYHEIVPFFEEILNTTSRVGKDIFVLDPAHDINFLAARTFFTTQVGIGIGTEGMSLAYALGRNRKMSRREFLTTIGVFAAGAALLKAPTKEAVSVIEEEKLHGKPSEVFSENNFRRSIVAQGLRQLGSQMDTDPSAPDTTMFMVLPPVMWKGIKRFLTDSKALAEMYKKDQMLRINDATIKSFFTIRQWRYQNNDWELVNQTRIK